MGVNLDGATRIASIVMTLGTLLISFLVWLSGRTDKKVERETSEEKTAREAREARALREIESQEAERKRLGDAVWEIVEGLRAQMADMRAETERDNLRNSERIAALEVLTREQVDTITKLQNENTELRGDLIQAKVQMTGLQIQNGTQHNELIEVREENRSLRDRVRNLETPHNQGS